jgi:hypothetical protein
MRGIVETETEYVLVARLVESCSRLLPESDFPTDMCVLLHIESAGLDLSMLSWHCIAIHTTARMEEISGKWRQYEDIFNHVYDKSHLSLAPL